MEHASTTGIEEQERGNNQMLIDIEKVVETKSPLLKRLLPRFLISYLKRLIHQDKLNYYLTTFGHLKGVEFIAAVLTDMNTTLEIKGLDHIPFHEKCIIASNHPLGGLDGLALMLAVSHRRPDIIFPVNDILMNVKPLKPLFIPINKHGSNAENIKIINDTFASDKVVCYFPFGLVSRKIKGKIKDIEWKTTFITKARRFERDVIPTHISGRNTSFFYNLSKYRKQLGIKANIEMLFLVDEFIKQSNHTLVITFGEAVPHATFDKRFTHVEWAEKMRKYTYRLGAGETRPFTALMHEL